MNRSIISGAHWLDAWLRLHLGRAYTGVLGAGLVLGIIASVNGLSHTVGSRTNILKVLGIVMFQVALLINQLAQFHDYRQERLRQRSVRGKGDETLPPDGA